MRDLKDRYRGDKPKSDDIRRCKTDRYNYIDRSIRPHWISTVLPSWSVDSLHNKYYVRIHLEWQQRENKEFSRKQKLNGDRKPGNNLSFIKESTTVSISYGYPTCPTIQQLIDKCMKISS